jgi:hypothetical protein
VIRPTQPASRTLGLWLGALDRLGLGFSNRDASDYRLFGIRYLILPARSRPPVPARLTMRSGPYWLWTISGGAYVQAGRIVGEISANRTNVGIRTVPLLHSGLAADGAYLGGRYGSRGGEGPLPTARSQSSAGVVIAESTDLDDDRHRAGVRGVREAPRPVSS